ncbi:MAG TPA: EamA family transporter [Acidimicrobiia bacterium]
MAAPLISRRTAPVCFVTGGIAMYAGAAIAYHLFDDVPPQTVAWLRCCGAAVVLAVVARPWRRHRVWTPATLRIAAAFGVATALMNTSFYLAIDRIPLGTAVAIEFAGPVTVAALSMRSRRSLAGLGAATIGVLVLSGVQLSGDALGVLFALGAAAFWAGYIVLGARVSRSATTSGVDGLTIGLVVGSLVLVPVGVWGSSPAFTSPHILLLCLVVGVLSTALPYGLDQLVLRVVDTSTFALLLALLPVTATAMGWIALHQHLEPAELVGVACVVLGLALNGIAEPAGEPALSA